MTTTKPSLSPKLREHARSLRKNSTDAERLLWGMLRNRQLEGYKFRRQHPYKGYILDFYCHEVGLVIELDGGGHTSDSQSRYDSERTRNLEADGLVVVRYWNDVVLEATEKVLEDIYVQLVAQAEKRRTIGK